ncbi:MAG: prepilin-type N-terminal cleavage/methylation domain-containing protein [Phycisphaerales bacterium]|nr:prepilin-type N-terminal cleavage/methylation domain-containing protein [Phycisphaerales bacterium]
MAGIEAGRARAGFTLIELLVVIVITSIIISILLPALAGAKQSAKETQALSNGRMVGAAFEQYAGEYTTYPYTDDAHLPEGVRVPPRPGIIFVKWYPVGTIVGTSSHWHLESLWPALLSATAPWAENYATWVSPGLETKLPSSEFEFDINDLKPHISWRYSNSFVASPRVWNESNPPRAEELPSLYRGAAPGDVLFPSGKVMLWDVDLSYVRKEPRLDETEDHYDFPTPMVFADGHADAINPLHAAPAARNAISGSRTRLHDTPDGIRGRDY